MSAPDLPPEVWSKIILLAKPTYKQLIQLSTVSQKFRRLILNKWFLKKCFTKYPMLTKDLLLHIDFTNVIETDQNPLMNSIGDMCGYHDSVVKHNDGITIETDELFNRILTFQTAKPIWLINAFNLQKCSLKTFSISLWFFYSTDGIIVFHFQRAYSWWWCIQITMDIEKQMKIRVILPSKIWDIDGGQRDEHVWHHVAITHGETSLHIYIDGQLIKKIDLQYGEPIRVHNLRIGCHFSSGSGLADIAVWGRRLLPEIKSIYQQKTSIKQADLIQGLLNGLSITAIHWNGNWAFACDFYKNDLTDARIPGEQCGGRCAATSGCTHFTSTTYNGGTCWMKHGHATKENAFSTGDRSVVCGVVEQISTDRTMYGVHTTRHGATEHGACALPTSNYAVVNPVALGNIESLKDLKFRPQLCGHVLNVDCGHGSLDIIVTNSNLGGGLDLYGSTWDKLTNHKPPGITSCKVRLTDRNAFNFHGPRC
ncbi:unnamed protein product [Adineta ricciae]|uniref:F-box domain-containing protein n=1 Tax=Adineta ricciae TaxID=249248 RepID=A0A814C4Q7_ADIRI|nr:unnamed protein product [Adineta ricciae]CAF1020208.1 unnamed protein product [Adineta ricciae]